MDIVQLLKFLGYLLAMLCVVPLVGMCVFGSRKLAWRYTVAWGRVMLITMAAGVLVWLAIAPFIPFPH
jgi:hypothetical protein